MTSAYTLTEQAESIRFGLGIVAGIVASLGVIVLPFWRPAKRKLAKIREGRDILSGQRQAAAILAVVKPEIESVRAAAKAQHDEQNKAMSAGFTALHSRLAHLDGRHDRLESHLAQHDIDIAVLHERTPTHDP